MKVTLLYEVNGKGLFKTVIIPWVDKPHKYYTTGRVKRMFTRPYWVSCWWLYDNTRLFREIPEGTKFSWRYLKVFRGVK